MAGRQPPGRRGAHASRRHVRAVKRRISPLIPLALAVTLAVAGIAAFALTRAQRSSATPPDPTTPHQTPALQVVSTTPADGASGVAPSTTLTVSLSTPLAPSSPLPTLSPPLAGSWTQLTPTELQFVSSGPLVPGNQVTVSIPAGPTGLKGADGQQLASPVTTSFTVAHGSELRLQQILAELGYLPLQFTPSSPLAAPQDAADPQPGTFSWRWSTLPAQLTAQWTQGSTNVITKAAVMNFENQHQLNVDGIAGPQVWASLLAALAAGQSDPQSYNNVYVSKNLPENVTVYENGVATYNSVANTGVAGAPTASGTFPVYLRYTSTTMSGTNPNGTHYSDPNIPWVSYFNGGDALHGFVRASYGFPQSDGCVEMPVANAKVVFPLTPLGTLVTVQ